MPTPTEILDLAAEAALGEPQTPRIANEEIAANVAFICRNIQNRAGVRLLLSCLLAKVHRPEIDIRKPYTEIGTEDSFSGRGYDEQYLGPFINAHQLPCNPTTAFLTPALRNRNIVLTPDVNLVGRPLKLYQTVLQLLIDVHEQRIDPQTMLVEIIRVLSQVKAERAQRMETLIAGLRSGVDTAIPLSAEAIVLMIQQHLNCKGASRLPVLVVAAAYIAAEEHLGERVLPLEGHYAADFQTGSLGDLEITLVNDDKVVSSYEMKMRRVSREDVDHALTKIRESGNRIDNYIFITTDVIEPEVADYAASLYEHTGGIKFVILDCIGFLRHFLHLFHRLRHSFLEAYQELVLSERESAVRQELKEVFLALRQAAESGTANNL